jgi:hypothetical protein
VRHTFSARIFQNFFSRKFLREIVAARILRARRACAARGSQNFRHVEKTPVFASDFAFFNISRVPRAARVRTACGAERGASRAAAPCARYRVSPSKTQEFACRIRGNAYYDRMKRVNCLPVVKSAGD